MASLAFFVTLLGVAAAMGLAWRHADTERGRLARSAFWGALAPLFIMLGAPLVASVAVGTGFVAWLFDESSAQGGSGERAGRRSLKIAACSLLVFVSVGTLARQVVTYGATVTERPEYGAQASVLAQWLPMAWPVLGLLLMWILLGAVERRERGGEGGESR